MTFKHPERHRKSGVIASAVSALTLVAALPAFAQPATTHSTLDAGTGGGPGIENVATVTGNFGSTEVVNDAYEEVSVATADPDISVVKSSAITTNGGTTGVGDKDDVITYTYTVKNEGNVTLTGISVADNHAGTGTLGSISCTTSGNATIASLAPDATETCTATYTVTQSDVDTLQ